MTLDTAVHPVDLIAADIRAIDGAHNLGAGELAQRLYELGYRKPCGAQTVREFLDPHGQGYLIQRSSNQYRYIWREAGEPDDEGAWFETQHGAIKAAWQDWSVNGASAYFFPWGKELEIASNG